MDTETRMMPPKMKLVQKSVSPTATMPAGMAPIMKAPMKRAVDAAATAEHRGAADEDGGQRREQGRVAHVRVEVHDLEALHHAGQRGGQARQHEEDDAGAPDGDAHQARRLGVVADDVGVLAQAMPVEQHPGDDGDADQPPELHRDAQGLAHQDLPRRIAPRRRRARTTCRPRARASGRGRGTGSRWSPPARAARSS